MGQTVQHKDPVLTAGAGKSNEKDRRDDLLDSVLDLFEMNASTCNDDQRNDYDDVLVKLIACVEMEARARAARRLAQIELAPRRIIRCLALEDIVVAKPILTDSVVLTDDDLLMVSRMRGVSHMAAIAGRKHLSGIVTDELMRRGDESVWEIVAGNNGAEITSKSLAAFVKCSRTNNTIQTLLMDRTDIPPSILKKIVVEAGEAVRAHLHNIGRKDLLMFLDQAKAEASKRVLSTSSVLGFEFDDAYRKMLQEEKTKPIVEQDLYAAALQDAFPRVVCLFSRLTGLEIDESAHWLSRREIDPSIVACRALGFEARTVEQLLKCGPWKRILPPDTRKKALVGFTAMDQKMAKRIFEGRRNTGDTSTH